MAAGHVVLVGVEAEAVAVGGEPGAHVADRRAGFGLADADAEQAVAARRGREPAVAELVGAEVLDRARRAVEDELGEDRARHVGAAELLEHDRGFDVAEAGAAPLLADRDAEQLGLARSRPTTPAGTPRSRRPGGPSARASARRRRGRAGAARPDPRCRRTGLTPWDCAEAGADMGARLLRLAGTSLLMTVVAIAPRTVPHVTGRDRHRLAASVLLVAVGTACGGGGRAADRCARTRAADDSAVATASVAATSAPTSRRLLDRARTRVDATPAPVIVDRGTDHVAIARLAHRVRTLARVAPPRSPRSSTRAYAPGSALARGIAADVAAMRRHERAHHRSRRRAAATTSCCRGSRTSCRFAQTEHLARREVVDLRRPGARNTSARRTEHYIVSIMRFGPDAPWRLNVRRTLETRAARGAADVAREGSGRARTAARFGVGIEARRRRRRPRSRSTHSSPSLPRLVHYVSTPLAPGRPGGLGNVCNAGDPAPIRRRSCSAGCTTSSPTPTTAACVSDTHECVPFPDPNDQSRPPPAPALPAPPTIGDVWRAVALPRPVVGANPVSRGVTGLDTRLWSGGAQTAQVAVTIGGVPGHRHRARRRVSLLDRRGLPRRLARPRAIRRARPPPIASRRRARIRSRSRRVWRATVHDDRRRRRRSRFPIDINTAVLTATVAYPVTEVRSRLVA